MLLTQTIRKAIKIHTPNCTYIQCYQQLHKLNLKSKLELA
jgi:hypothetical protein